MKRLSLLLTCFFISMSLAIAQTKTVTGVVVDEEGETVIGASVLIKGTTAGTVTSAEGIFSLSVPESATTLVVKYIGMQDREVAISNNMRIVMKTSSTSLDEVVVTAMGIQRADRSVGYAVSKVDPNKATQKAEPDLLRSLDGKIPGVQVNASSATAGSATKVTIRGSSSFYGNNAPLYVVDGIPYSDPVAKPSLSDALTTGLAYGTGISTLDPNDIESMNVLKGAAAAALYGSRAANGVILITTKSGAKKTRPSQKGFEVNFAGSYATESVASLPEYQNTYGAGTNFQYSNANGSWGADFKDLDVFPTWSNYLAAYPSMSATQEYRAYPNNVKDLFQTGGIYDFSVNIQSYNDKGNFSTTVSRTQQDGYIPHSDFERSSFSVGGNQKLDNGLRVSGTVSYSRTLQDGPIFGVGNYNGSASSFARTMLLPRNFDTSSNLPYETPTQTNLFPLSNVDHPLWSWKYNTNSTTSDRSIANVGTGYDILKWISVDYQIGINQYSLKREQVINLGSVGASGKGRITNNHLTSQEIESNFLITLKHDFGTDYKLKAVLGHNVNQRTTETAKEVGTEMIFKDIYIVDNTQTQTAEETFERRRLWALFADVQLSYRNYAFLNATLRNDHSSTLPKDNNSYYYPAIVGSFVFSDAFEMNPDIMNFGKVRIGWGTVGNDALPYYKNGSFIFDTPFDSRSAMLVPIYVYDPNLKPEFTSEFEVGTELQFFNNRIGLDFSWYNRNSKDMIADISLPRSTGSARYYTNFGKLNNKGVEIGLSLTPIELRDSFRWNIYTVFSKNISEVMELTEGIQRLTVSTGSTSEPQPTYQVGSPYGVLRGSVIARDDEGNPLVNPSTGGYMLSPELGVLGNPNPDFKSTITNTFSFKGITLSCMFDMTVGGVICAGSVVDMLGRGVTKDTEDRLGTRILPGVLANPNTQKPILDENGKKIPNTVQINENGMYFASSSVSPTLGSNGVQEFSAYDATVFRLGEISLGYNLPKQWLKKTFIGSANVSVVGRNLWHYAPGFPKYMNYDPVSNAFGVGNAQGIEREAAPTVRRIGFNLKLSF